MESLTISGNSKQEIYTSLLPQVEAVLAHDYEVLYLTEDIDEFALQILREYDSKEFLNVCTENLDLADDADKEKLKEANEGAKDVFEFIRDSLSGAVAKVQYTNHLHNHAVSLSSEGALSVGMEQILNKMPGAEDQHIKAETVLEINVDHPIKDKLNDLFENDKDKLRDYSKILYAQARLINGLSIDNPAEIADLVCSLML